jgi:peptidoglycan hydrolase-like protein with peptidoglycan-binding domain
MNNLVQDNPLEDATGYAAASWQMEAPASSLAKRRRWVIAVVVACVAVGPVGFALGSTMSSPKQLAAEAKAPAPDVLTSTVELRPLSSSVVMRGTVSAGQSVQVSNVGSQSDGGQKPVVTALRTGEGKQVAAGSAPVEIDGRPVILLQGSLPAYRDLKPTDTGPDVKQLQQALDSLGYSTSGDTAGVFGPATGRALTSLYKSLGYQPIPGLTDGGKQLQAAKDAVTAAEAADKSAPAGPAKSAADTALSEAKQHQNQISAQIGPALPAAEVVFLKTFPATVTDLSVQRGSQLDGSPIMTLSSGTFVVQGYLSQDQKGLVKPGQQAQILDETSGFTAAASVSTVANSQSTQGTGAQAQPLGFKFTVTPDKPLQAALLAQDVRITMQTATTGKPVLVVPVSAVSTAADSSTVVTVVDAAGAQHRVPVSVGASADGYVAVQPQGTSTLSPGDRVLTGVAQQTP